MYKYTLIIGFILLYYSLVAQNKMNDAVACEASITNDFSSNLMGGIKKGSVAMGLIDMVAAISTENAGWWKGGEIYMRGQNTHGGSMTGEYVGDIQTLSNLENGNYTYLYEFLYSHQFKKLQICAGIHDLNSELVSSDYGGLYLNSSFGIMPSISMNVPVAIFPHNALAFILQYQASDNFSINAAIYDGNPESLDDNQYGLEYKLRKGDGYFAIAELNYSFIKDSISKGFIKIAGYQSSMKYQNYKDTNKINSGTFGMYLISDYLLAPKKKNREEGLGMFIIAGYAPAETNMFSSFIGIGLNYKGLCNKFDDELGLGIAHLSLSKYLQNPLFNNFETAIELTYKIQLTDNFSIQPDLHYIINPGMDKSLNNAFVTTLRTQISF